ncbi:MAG: glycosyltransferase [Spirochaetia bacterium]
MIDTMAEKLTFTICTPLYNEAERVKPLYRSLDAQSERSFEWLVIDDGSGDGGADEAEKLGENASFPVRVIRKKNHRGSHVAVNKAAEEARGKFLLVLHSDEELLPQSLERFLNHWESIPSAERPFFTSVTGLSQTHDGTVRGDKFPADIFDSTNFEAGGRYGISGRKFGFQRTEVLKEFSFPEKKGERFCPTELVLNRVGLRYLTRYVNEALVTVHTAEEEDTPRKAEMGALDRDVPPMEMCILGPAGSALFFRELMSLPVPLARKIKAAIAYVRLSLHAGQIPDDIYKEAPRKLFVFFALTPGFFLYRRDIQKGIQAP